MYYYIWCDESDKHGEYYSNFYGGILVKSEDYEPVLRESAALVEKLGINEEIKWQKVNEYWFEKYVAVVDFIFRLLSDGKIKIRIFFRNNQYVPVGLTREQIRKEYPMLYYQFIKHAFGLQYSNQTQEPVFIHLMLDDIPLKGSDKDEFKDYIYRLNFDDSFKKANIHIHRDEISEVDSSKHIMAQRNNTVGRLTEADVSRALGQSATVVSAPSVTVNSDNSELRSTLTEASDVIDRLSAILASGIHASVYIDGPDGVAHQYDMYNKMKSRK